MSWGSADLVPTSWPLRSESALGSVVPLPCPPPRLRVTLSLEVHGIKGLIPDSEVTHEELRRLPTDR
jgi:hypothetical protein